MKFGVMKESTILNRFNLHTLHRNITHLAKNKHNTRYFERWGGKWKRAQKRYYVFQLKRDKKN